MADRGRKSRPATSPMLEERWYRRDFELHRAAVNGAKSMTDSSKPLAMSMTHVRPNNPKARYFAELRENEIQEENERLLNKMSKIIMTDVRQSLSCFGGSNIERSLFRTSLNNQHPGIRVAANQVPVIDHWNAHVPGFRSGRAESVFQSSYSLADVTFTASRTKVGSRGGPPLYVAQPAAYLDQDTEFPDAGKKEDIYSSMSDSDTYSDFESESDGRRGADNNQNNGRRESRASSIAVNLPSIAEATSVTSLASSAARTETQDQRPGSAGSTAPSIASSAAISTRSSMSSVEARQQIRSFMEESALASPGAGGRPAPLAHASPRSKSASPSCSNTASPRSSLVNLGAGAARPQAPAQRTRNDPSSKAGGSLVPTGFAGFAAFRPGTAPTDQPSGGLSSDFLANRQRYASQQGESFGAWGTTPPPRVSSSNLSLRPTTACSAETSDPDSSTPVKPRTANQADRRVTMESILPSVPEGSSYREQQTALAVLEAALATRSGNGATITTADGTVIPLPKSRGGPRPNSKAGRRSTSPDKRPSEGYAPSPLASSSKTALGAGISASTDDLPQLAAPISAN